MRVWWNWNTQRSLKPPLRTEIVGSNPTTRTHYMLLRGLPPAWVFRFAASWRKYSLPRFAVTLPPLCPMIAAAGLPLCFSRSSVSARAARSSSWHRGVLFSGRGSVVERIRSVSDMRFFNASSELLSDGISLRYGGTEVKASVRCFIFNAHFRHYPRARCCSISAYTEPWP